MAKHLNCKCCQKPIILVPSAEERAAKDRNGNTAAYYRNLFKICSDCQVKSWYSR